jgi:hypothetical protein
MLRCAFTLIEIAEPGARTLFVVATNNVILLPEVKKRHYMEKYFRLTLSKFIVGIL